LLKLLKTGLIGLSGFQYFQYEIAARHGGAIDVCVQAGLVTAAYLQAKDESHYG